LKERVQALYKGEGMDNWVVVLQHPPIYTLGTKELLQLFKD
jgi:lipoate-protein ligase B